MKILIISPGGITNYGERAIMFGTVLKLKKDYPDGDITILGYQNLSVDDPFMFNEFEKLKIKYLADDFIKGKNKFTKAISLASLFLLPKFFLPRKVYDAVKVSDRIYSKGQEGFTGYYGWVHFIDSLSDIYIISRLNKNVIIYGQSVGPLFGYLQQLITKFVLRKIKHIYVRDQISFNLLKNLKINSDKFTLIPDLAYTAMDFFKTEKIDASNKVIIIPNMAIIKNKMQEQMYMENLTSIIKGLITKNTKVILTSTVTTTDWNNDFYLCNKLHDLFPETELKVYSSIDTVIREIHNCKFLISSRLHPLIFATGLDKQVVAISEAPKVLGVLSAFGHNNVIVSPFKKVSDSEIHKICNL